jgi:hypothetical protein
MSGHHGVILLADSPQEEQTDGGKLKKQWKFF